MLPCVTLFGEFSERAESIIMGGDRRSELDKAYNMLIDSVFSTIERVAKEHPKSPPDVVRFGQFCGHVTLSPSPLVPHSSPLPSSPLYMCLRELPPPDGHPVSDEDHLSGALER